MAAFEYHALDSRGKQKTGIIEADSARQARQQLREQGMAPLRVESTAQGELQREKWRFGGGISVSDLALITRQLATLVQAALPIEEALKAISRQCEKPRLRRVMASVRARVVEGFTLADGLREFPLAFDRLYCAMVAAGEKSGHLDKVLNRLADYTEQRRHMKAKLTQAMIYPAMLTLISIGVVTVLLSSVVPKVVEQFVHMGQSLPLSTRILMGASDAVQRYGLPALVLLILLGLGYKRWLQIASNRQRYHALLLRLPVIGRVALGLNTARFARTLSILNSSSVPLLEGIRIAGEVLSNLEVKAAVTMVAERVREGSSLWAALDQSRLFPPMMLHMIASGEQSGELDQMLERAADNQDREFESQVNLALGIFEPALIVVMAGIVLFIVISIMQPMLALNNMVGM